MTHLDLAQAIKEARRAAGLTQDQLADKAELSYSSLAKLEQGVIHEPSFFTVLRLSEALSVPIGELIANTTKSSTGAARSAENSIKVVLFDLHGVLVEQWEHVFSLLAEKTHRDPRTIEDIFWRLDSSVASNEIPLSKLEERMAHELEVSQNDVDYFTYYVQACKPHKPALELIALAKSYNVKVGLLTDDYPTALKRLEKSQALPALTTFDYCFESHTMKSKKPAAAVYDYVEARLKVEPNQIVFLDDKQVNLEPAAARGWHTIRYDQDHHSHAKSTLAELLGV